MAYIHNLAIDQYQSNILKALEDIVRPIIGERCKSKDTDEFEYKTDDGRCLVCVTYEKIDDFILLFQSQKKADIGVDIVKDMLTKEFAADLPLVDRVELIDGTGRVYVKGSIYGTPINVNLSIQDKGRTLKIFVEDK